MATYKIFRKKDENGKIKLYHNSNGIIHNASAYNKQCLICRYLNTEMTNSYLSLKINDINEYYEIVAHKELIEHIKNNYNDSVYKRFIDTGTLYLYNKKSLNKPTPTAYKLIYRKTNPVIKFTYDYTNDTITKSDCIINNNAFTVSSNILDKIKEFKNTNRIKCDSIDNKITEPFEYADKKAQRIFQWFKDNKKKLRFFKKFSNPPKKI